MNQGGFKAILLLYHYIMGLNSSSQGKGGKGID
jgi:hypothetical protein